MAGPRCPGPAGPAPDRSCGPSRPPPSAPPAAGPVRRSGPPVPPGSGTGAAPGSGSEPPGRASGPGAGAAPGSGTGPPGRASAPPSVPPAAPPRSPFRAAAPPGWGSYSWSGITLRHTRSKVSKSTTARSVSRAGAVCLCSTVAPSLSRACARLDSPHPMRRRGGWIQVSPFSRFSDFLQKRSVSLVSLFSQRRQCRFNPGPGSTPWSTPPTSFPMRTASP